MSNKTLKKSSFFDLMKEYKSHFVIYFVAIFALIFTATYILGIVPVELQVQSESEKVDSSLAVSEYGYGQQVQEVPNSNALPTQIIIEKVGINSIIQHPDSQEVAVLDNALQKGAVYYPGSGTLSTGNVFLFGHSTNHKVVNNQAYKTFNRLEELVKGDKITIKGDDGKTYIYEVVTNTTKADSEILVQFNTNKRMITVSTCNTFGKKEERHVVEAQLVEER